MDPKGPDSPSASQSDRSLVVLVREGDEDAARELYSRYVRRLFGLVEAKMGSRLRTQTTPEDIVQSVFKSIFRGVKSGHYDAPPGETLWNLMAIVAVHKLSRSGARHSAQRRDASRNVSLSIVGDQLSSDSFSAEMLEVSFREMLSLMRPIDRVILELRLQQNTVDEISEATGRSRRTVERSLQNSRQRLVNLVFEDTSC